MRRYFCSHRGSRLSRWWFNVASVTSTFWLHHLKCPVTSKYGCKQHFRNRQLWLTERELLVNRFWIRIAGQPASFPACSSQTLYMTFTQPLSYSCSRPETFSAMWTSRKGKFHSTFHWAHWASLADRYTVQLRSANWIHHVAPGSSCTSCRPVGSEIRRSSGLPCFSTPTDALVQTGLGECSWAAGSL